MSSTWARFIERLALRKRLGSQCLSMVRSRRDRRLILESLEERMLLAASTTRADLIYNWNAGSVRLDAAEADGQILVNFVLRNDGAAFGPMDELFPEQLAGIPRDATSIATADEISWTDSEVLVSGAVWESHPGKGASLDLGEVLPKGLEPSQLADLLTQATYVGTPGTGVQEFDLIVQKAFPWQNPWDAFDVDANAHIEPLDVLIIVNDINAEGARPLPNPPAAPDIAPPFLDTSGDNEVTPLDALVIINFLNSASSGEGGSGRGTLRESTVVEGEGVTNLAITDMEPDQSESPLDFETALRTPMLPSAPASDRSDASLAELPEVTERDNSTMVWLDAIDSVITEELAWLNEPFW